MSKHFTRSNNATGDIDTERGWAVWRCPQGCIHLSLDRLSVTLNEEDLHALSRLLQRAVTGSPHAGLDASSRLPH